MTNKNVVLIGSHYIDELSGKGNPCVRYFVARLIQHPTKLTCDPDELVNVSWYTIPNALGLDKLKDSRKIILKNAYLLIQGNQPQYDII